MLWIPVHNQWTLPHLPLPQHNWHNKEKIFDQQVDFWLGYHIIKYKQQQHNQNSLRFSFLVEFIKKVINYFFVFNDSMNKIHWVNSGEESSECQIKCKNAL